MTVAEIRVQIEEYIDQIPPEHLGSVLDFVAFLADRESEDATEEYQVELAKQEYRNGDFLTLEEYHTQRSK